MVQAPGRLEHRRVALAGQSDRAEGGGGHAAGGLPASGEGGRVSRVEEDRARSRAGSFDECEVLRRVKRGQLGLRHRIDLSDPFHPGFGCQGRFEQAGGERPTRHLERVARPEVIPPEPLVPDHGQTARGHRRNPERTPLRPRPRRGAERRRAAPSPVLPSERSTPHLRRPLRAPRPSRSSAHGGRSASAERHRSSGRL